MSRIAVFGATGLTGGLVVRRALAQGHEVVALVRDPARMRLEHPALVVIGGSPTAISDVERCVQGADAVIHCLGIGGKGDGRPTTLVSDSVKAVLAAMQRHGVPRIVCMSNVGAGGSGTWVANRLVIPSSRTRTAWRRHCAPAPSSGSRCACPTSWTDPTSPGG
jgi:uncharacterized protein YbjT (DUF2867 family)